MTLGTQTERPSAAAAANPYLLFAATLAAGLTGIDATYPLPPALDRAVTEMTAEELAARGIVPLPASLGDAIPAFEQSTLMRDILGPHIAHSLVANKRQEWEQFRREVTEFELRRYLGNL